MNSSDSGSVRPTLRRLYSDLSSSPVGLTSSEARERFIRYRPNEPAPHRPTALFAEVGVYSANPLVIILLIARAVTAFLGEVVSAAIIFVMVALSISLNYVQTFRSRTAVERPQAAVSPNASVLRAGEWVEVHR